jgi:hypothetical protein
MLAEHTSIVHQHSWLAHLYDINEIIYCGVFLEQQVAVVDFVLLQGRQQALVCALSDPSQLSVRAAV